MEAWHLLWDFRIVKDLARNLPAESRLGAKALYVGNEMLNVFKHDDLSSIGKARKVAEQVLGEGWQKLGEKVFESEPGNKDDVPIWAMSNCHIDTAWLWPFRVTQQKTARSWSTLVFCSIIEEAGRTEAEPASQPMRSDGSLPRAPLRCESGTTIQVA